MHSFLAKLFQRDIVEVGNDLGGGALAAVLAGARSYTGVEMSSTTDLAVKLTETYPNVAVTEDIGSAIDQVKNADVLIISAEPETNSPLAQAVSAGAKVTKDRMAVIRL